ncbi:MAG TPA: fumarylacetoacetate hydrolase family protein [Acidimicrobiales bacterium]|nr:fumarylacetoacetate hydrolase family protein [Acidimicrobiales bacterium]
MKVAAFAAADGPHLGVVVGDEVADVSAADPALRADLASVLAGGGLDVLWRAAARAPRHPLDAVALRAPVARPPKVLAIGLNYRDHAAETGREAPQHQLWFNKQSTCVIGPGAAIEVPRESEQVDYEGELGIVIGRRCRHVPAARAAEAVAGWLVVNDVSVRDWQYRTPTFTMGKSWDTHGPMGPWMVTADELVDPHALRLRTTVNGDLRQDGFTGDMVFNCWEMIECLSTAFTLEPGDVISTGTPAGVGMARRPPAWLRAGDTVRVEIEGIGSLENPVIDAPDPAPLGLD